MNDIYIDVKMNDAYINVKKQNKKISSLFEKEFVSVEDILNKLDEMINEVDDLNEKIQHIEQDREENYRPVPVAEQVGISDRDFV